jgi:hypothetical protein
MTTATATAAPLFTLPGTDPVRRPRPLEPAPAPPVERAPARVHRLAHGRLTLDELVSGAWAAIGAGAPAACPVCDGALRPGADTARCGRCGSELA